MFKKIFFYLIIGISVLVIIGTLFSLLHHMSRWYIQVLDFARLQFLVLAFICLILFLALKKGWQFSSVALTLGLVSVISLQAIYIIPYTAFGEKTIAPADAATTGNVHTISILIANVLKSNRNADGLLEIISNTDPDLILAMETDRWWTEQLALLKDEYPYTMLHPLNNTYGMALYSRFPLNQSEIKFLSEAKVPSFHTQVQLPSGETFMFHGVHPVPPMPSKKHPDNIGDREVTLVKVAEMVTSNSLPDVVAGDYNDVSWSHTSRLFQSSADLNNVRLGRGLYNTFSTKSLIMRWPLDHYFVTGEFSLLELERLPEFNSDHFPMFARLALKENRP